jgi:hypothetical protein
MLILSFVITNVELTEYWYFVASESQGNKEETRVLCTVSIYRDDVGCLVLLTSY